jgi:hypothetical protein
VCRISDSDATFGYAVYKGDLRCSLGSRDASSQELGVGS